VLESEICELAGHLAAAMCRFLMLVGEFDAREGWASWDMQSCAAWLSWKCQLAAGTAREQVRVARKLRALPVIRGEFAAGRLSYAKVRALTRIAAPDSDAGLAEMAGPMTGNQLERFARAHRTVTRAIDEQARIQRRLTWRLEEDGSLSLSVRLPPEDGAALLAALRAATADTATGPGPDPDPAGAEEAEAAFPRKRRPGRPRPAWPTRWCRSPRPTSPARPAPPPTPTSTRSSSTPLPTCSPPTPPPLHPAPLSRLPRDRPAAATSRTAPRSAGPRCR
jgi:hypothetical protein